MTVALGLRANAGQFTLLVALNVLVGAMVGLERSVLPVVGERDFGIDSTMALLTFVVAFGVAKALSNLVAGGTADRVGRKPLLVAGWALALPVPILIAVAPNWSFVVAANAFLGASQGLAWSMTVLMKIDLAGPRRRGLALGLNESAGYVGVAAAAFATGALAAAIAPRTAVWTTAAVVAVLGTAAALVLVRDTRAHVAAEELGPPPAFRSGPTPFACAQAGFVNNLNDAVVWGLAPLYVAAAGGSPRQIGAVAAAYPAVWGVGQAAAGWLADAVHRGALIAAGMLVQAAALVLLAAGGGAFGPSLAAAIVLGMGTALAYPTLLAAVSDAVAPRNRAAALGRYRFWRDSGFVAGALAAGVGADVFGATAAFVVVAVLTAAAGAGILVRRPSEKTMARIGKLRLDEPGGGL